MNSKNRAKHRSSKDLQTGGDTRPRVIINATGEQDLPAGDFSSWLRHIRDALLTDGETKVDCGECVACCSSSQFIHIRPEETRTLGRIRKDLLVAAPGLPKGHMLLGYDKNGLCPLLTKGKCSIYEHRPLTCRIYDCRVFTAAGIAAGGGDKTRITKRVRRWKFSYPAKLDCDEHSAIQTAAKFIQEHAACFPGGRIPNSPSQLAILAIKVFDVFLKKEGFSAVVESASSDVETANAIVEACRKFDARRPPSAL